MLQKNDKIKFAELMQLLAKRFNGGRELTELDLKSYWLALADEFNDIKQFEKAIIKLMKTWKYGRMPEPSYFIEAKKRYNDIEIDNMARLAWKSVIEALEKGVGYNKTAYFEDDLIPFIVNTICNGFEKLCNRKDYELEEIGKQFRAYYKNILKNETKIKKVEVRSQIENPKAIKIKAEYETSNDIVLIENKSKNDNEEKVKNLLKIKRF